jgi:hypothetical protein
LIEQYYFGSVTERNKLLPEKFHNKEINLVVPEDVKGNSGYRADLTIYFKKVPEGVPVEVKWVAEEFNKRNQIDYIKEHHGFLVSFSDDIIEGVPSIKINIEDFNNWVSSNISKLLRESISEKVKSEENIVPKQYWLIYLRGKGAEKHFSSILEHPNDGFWAFKQDRRAIKNILNIQKGDTCLFLIAKGYKQNQGYSNKPDVKLFINSFHLCDVKEPHYMALDDKRGLFFEKGIKPISERRWPHFIDFKIKESKDIFKDYGKQEKLGTKLAQSANFGGGTPVNLNLSEYEELIDKLRQMK